MRRRPIAFALLLAAAAVACGEAFFAGDYDVSGRWTGRARLVAGADTAVYDVVLDLEQDEDRVSGSGEIRSETTVAVEVEGDWEFPAIDLVLSADGYQPVLFDAQFAADSARTRPDSIAGTLTGSGFSGTPLSIVRVITP